MADVDWIEELKANAPDSERAFLKEVLCFFKRCPISEEFQNALDTDFPATRGLLEEQVTIGMEEIMTYPNSCEDIFEKEGEFVTKLRGTLRTGKYWDESEYGIVFKTGFYWMDSALEGYQSDYALFYYDADSKEAVFIHNTGGRSEYGNEPYYKTTLKYRLATGLDARLNLLDYIKEREQELKLANSEQNDDYGFTLWYLGRNCKSEEPTPPLGIFNWMW